MKRKIVFVTKSLCYHQVGIADNLYSCFGDDFAFIQMREPLPFRVQNKQEGFERPYLFGDQKDEESRVECEHLIKNAELIIWGEASSKVLKKSRKNAILLKYSERIFKKGYYKANLLHSFINCINLFRLKLFMHGREGYLLSAGFYSAKDYNRFGLFKGKSLKWGYFPKFDECGRHLNFPDGVLKILWVNRLLKWKHPEYAVIAAKTLKEKGISFELNIVGDGDKKSGEMKKWLVKKIEKEHLSNNVHMLGKINPKAVLDLYKKTDIALFTSGPAEGWGVGLNEAMNFGCVTLSSDKMGSAKYLIKDKENGFTYKFNSKKSFVESLLYIVSNRTGFDEISKNAYETIKEMWSCDNASFRLEQIIKELLEHKQIISSFEDGPCSFVKD